MVGGGAYMVGRSQANAANRERDQEARIAELEAQQYAPPPPAAAPAAAAAPAGGTDLVSKLKQLQELQQAGVLSPEEFEAAKQKVLAG
jgi:hypothetical protein